MQSILKSTFMCSGTNTPFAIALRIFTVAVPLVLEITSAPIVFGKNHPQDGQQSVADTKSSKAEAQAKAGATFLLEQAKKDSQLWDATRGFVMPPKPSVLRLIDRNQDVMKQRFPDADQSISALIRIFELFWSHFASVQRQINDRVSPLPGQFRSKLQYVLRSARPVDNLDVAGSARALAEAETEWVIAQINRHVAAQPVSDKQLMDEADVNDKMALLDGMRLVERDLRKDQIAILRREVLQFFGDKS